MNTSLYLQRRHIVTAVKSRTLRVCQVNGTSPWDWGLVRRRCFRVTERKREAQVQRTKAEHSVQPFNSGFERASRDSNTRERTQARNTQHLCQLMKWMFRYGFLVSFRNTVSVYSVVVLNLIEMSSSLAKLDIFYEYIPRRQCVVSACTVKQSAQRKIIQHSTIQQRDEVRTNTRTKYTISRAWAKGMLRYACSEDTLSSRNIITKLCRVWQVNGSMRLKADTENFVERKSQRGAP